MSSNILFVCWQGWYSFWRITYHIFPWIAWFPQNDFSLKRIGKVLCHHIVREMISDAEMAKLLHKWDNFQHLSQLTPWGQDAHHNPPKMTIKLNDVKRKDFCRWNYSLHNFMWPFPCQTLIGWVLDVKETEWEWHELFLRSP